MKCSRLWRFVMYAVWISLGYYVAEKSLFVLSGVSLSTTDLYPLVFPLMAAFFLSTFGGPIKNTKKNWMIPLVLSLVALVCAAFSLQMVWLNFDTIFLVPFVTSLAFFVSLGLFIFYPYEFLERNSNLLTVMLVVYVIGLAVFLGAQYEWLFIVNVILNVLSFAFYHLSLPITVVPEVFMVGMRDFRVGIGLPCIGITSFLLFWSSYGLYGVVEWGRKQLNIAHFIIVFVVGFIILFLLNVTRIGALVYIGAEYSPEFAINMFHEFAGVALFLVFTIPYFLLTRRLIQKH